MHLPAPLRTLAYAALAGGLLLTASCRKTTESPDEDITTANDRSDDNAETAISAEALRSVSPAAAAGATSSNPETTGTDYVSTDADFKARFGTCATRSYNANSRILTIDFGPTNCLCADGRYRRGKILVQFTTEQLTRRAGAVVTRDNYFVNDNQHTATRIFTDQGNGSFTVSVPQASIIYAAANGGGTHSWTADWTFTCTAGYGTPSVLDDVYKVTGSAQGTNRKGVDYTATIQTPLVKRYDCLVQSKAFKYYVHGVLVLTNAKGRTLTLDYDPTNTYACDNIATVTVNGRTYTITLK